MDAREQVTTNWFGLLLGFALPNLSREHGKPPSLQAMKFKDKTGGVPFGIRFPPILKLGQTTLQTMNPRKPREVKRSSGALRQLAAIRKARQELRGGQPRQSHRLHLHHAGAWDLGGGGLRWVGGIELGEEGFQEQPNPTGLRRFICRFCLLSPFGSLLQPAKSCRDVIFFAGQAGARCFAIPELGF